MKKGFTVIEVLIVVVIVAICATAVVMCVGGSGLGCSNPDTSANPNEQREESIETRAEMFARAEALWPIPEVHNFLAREMLVKYTERQDAVDHPFYIYVLSDVGTIIGYYVSQSAPVSINAFLSSTEDVQIHYQEFGFVLTAPSLDGIYYGGAGASQGNDGWFFFDAETDTLIILYDMKIIAMDQPLNINAPHLSVGNYSE